jgi:hypothetical protein
MNMSAIRDSRKFAATKFSCFTVFCGINYILLPAFSLEMMDKVEPPPIPEGYGISIAFSCLLGVIKGVHQIVEGDETGKIPVDTIPMEKQKPGMFRVAVS